ncbi:hypothetical protein ASE92_14350 [Pedobacter sp. Leaf41]|jgi:flagellar biosynthesis chaperone FliJ|uniref:hypothetical protein n=1 Tax=Pedobacter sp. Leaf41 TaxID=1736218 RepID=UPI0007038428|nr:hypothetical protein [Pedobacter sp. Leaf41]KQN33830.1 hypothetical protein ASE92_14350 [Pedobacter sp. Leaf41]
MGILVSVKNQQEEKVLIAFLESLNYKYQSGVEDKADDMESDFANQYNEEINQADTQIAKGEFILHEDVEAYFAKRRNSNT